MRTRTGVSPCRPGWNGVERGRVEPRMNAVEHLGLDHPSRLVHDEADEDLAFQPGLLCFRRVDDPVEQGAEAADDLGHHVHVVGDLAGSGGRRDLRGRGERNQQAEEDQRAHRREGGKAAPEATAPRGDRCGSGREAFLRSR